MTVEDQHSWVTPLLRQPPPSALIVWELDFGGYVASVKAHLGSFPQHRCSRPRHDQPAPSRCCQGAAPGPEEAEKWAAPTSGVEVLAVVEADCFEECELKPAAVSGRRPG